VPHLTANSARFHYQQAGTGPDVVLLHAVTANLAVWLFINLVDTLARDYHVTAYDLRGHGLSEATLAGYTSAEMAEDFRQLHDALRLGPAYLVGHSFGGVVALHAAVLFPDKVAGLILSDPYFPGLADLEPNLGQANVWVDLQEVFRHAGLEMPREVDFTTLFRMVAEMSSEQMNKLREGMGPASVRWLAQLPRLASTTCGADVFAVAGLTADRIRSVRQPVVALYDEHSPFLATCRYLRDNLPDCTVEIVPGARHLAPVQNGPLFVELVSKHLAQLRQRVPVGAA
jgi:pimeloyl-ACP methyl ester carboxylesterase